MDIIYIYIYFFLLQFTHKVHALLDNKSEKHILLISSVISVCFVVVALKTNTSLCR